MARSATSWRKGQSGNPAGRPRNPLARAALRAALAAPVGDGTDETRLEQWARQIVEQALDVETRLAILKFLEGTAPPPEPPDEPAADFRPRIIIPGLTDAMPSRRKR